MGLRFAVILEYDLKALQETYNRSCFIVSEWIICGGKVQQTVNDGFHRLPANLALDFLTVIENEYF